MRILFTAIALFICGSVFSQIYAPLVPTSYGSHFNRVKADSALHMPEKDTLLKNTVDTSAQIFINRKDSLIWAYTKARGFFKIEQSAGTGVTSADTALMLLPYLRIADSTALNGYATQYDLTLLSTGGDLNTTLHLGNTSDTSILLTADGAGDIGIFVANEDGAGVILGTIDDIGFISISQVGGFNPARIVAPVENGGTYFLRSNGGGNDSLALYSDVLSHSIDSLFGVQDTLFTGNRIAHMGSQYLTLKVNQEDYIEIGGGSPAIHLTHNATSLDNDLYLDVSASNPNFSYFFRNVANTAVVGMDAYPNYISMYTYFSNYFRITSTALGATNHMEFHTGNSDVDYYDDSLLYRPFRGQWNIDSLRTGVFGDEVMTWAGGMVRKVGISTLIDTSLYATQYDLTLVGGTTPTLQQVLTAGNTGSYPIFLNTGSAFGVLSSIPGGSVEAEIGSFSNVGFLTLSNAISYTTTVKTQAALSTFATNYLPNTGNATDTLATLYDIRTAGGGGGVTSFTDGNGFDGTVTGSALSLTTTLSNSLIPRSNSGALYGDARLSFDAAGATLYAGATNDFDLEAYNGSSFSSAVAGIQGWQGDYVYMYATDAVGLTAASRIYVYKDSIRIQPYQGKMNIDSLRSATDTVKNKPMVWNTDNGMWSYLTYWPSGGGGSQNLSWNTGTHAVDISGGTSAVIPFATIATSGILSSTTQTIDGIKTFDDAIQASSYIEWKSSTGSVMGVLANRSSGIDDYGMVQFYNDLNANIVNFSILNPTATRNINLPDASGTLALTSDIVAATVTAAANGTRLSGTTVMLDNGSNPLSANVFIDGGTNGKNIDLYGGGSGLHLGSKSSTEIYSSGIDSAEFFISARTRFSSDQHTTSFTLTKSNPDNVLKQISSNQTLTFPMWGNDGYIITIFNQNNSGFSWLTSGSVVEPDGTAITTIPNQTLSWYRFDRVSSSGTFGKWVHFTTGGVGSGSGTVNTGVAGKAAYYPTSTTTVDDFAAVDFATSGTNVTITQQNTTDVGLLIQLAGSAAEDAFRIKDNGGQVLTSFNEEGELIFDGASDAGTYQIQTHKPVLFVAPNNALIAQFQEASTGGAIGLYGTSGGARLVFGGYGNIYGTGAIGFNANTNAVAEMTSTGTTFGSNQTSSYTHSNIVNVWALDAGTNNIIYGQRNTHQSSGTVTTGFGVGNEYELENASDNLKVVGTTDFVYTDATNATEDADWVLSLMKAGTKAEALRVLSTGELKVQLLNNDDAEAKIVVWNSTDKIFEYRTAASLGGSGETNTGSNLGGGLDNYSTKVGVDLRFNTFAAADFDLASNLITIDATKWLTISAAAAAYQPLDADLTYLAGFTPSANVKTILNAADYAAVKTALTLTVGTDVEAHDADLTTLAGLTATTDNFIVGVSSAWASRTPTQVRTTLALTIGTDVQAFDADLTTWAGITPGTNVGTFLATPSSANLRAALTDENGTGAALFNSATAVSLSFTSAIISNNAVTASGNAATVPITSSLTTVTNNSAATLTITLTTGAADGQETTVRVLDFSGVAQTIAWVNTENSAITAPTTSNGSTTLFLTIRFIYNASTSKWRCIGYAGWELWSILIALLLGAIATKLEKEVKKYA